MARIKIVDKVKLPKNKLNIIRKAAHFYLKSSLPKCKVKELKTKIIVIGAETSEDSGQCYYNDKNSYDIIIVLYGKTNQHFFNFLHTLAHEFVHLKQIELKELNYENYKWKNRHIDKSTDYHDLPWEIDANGRAWGLVIKFLQSSPTLEKFIPLL